MKRRERPVVGIDGLGYVGLVTGLAFAARGHGVVGFDINDERRKEIGAGRSPISERGLKGLLRRELSAGRFRVVDSLGALVDQTQGIFLCLPTPSRPSGRIDLRPMSTGVRQLGRSLRRASGDRIVVVKSTVVPGTTETLVRPLLERMSGKNHGEISVAANPEFLSEGSMVQDALHPVRIVIGTSEPRAKVWLTSLYRPFRAPILSLSPTGAELVKYASNEFLALKVSFANEVSRLAESLGLDIDEVMQCVGLDPRIGARFLHAGPGFGGSCFEKDVRALAARARDLGAPLRLAEATLKVNQEQTTHAFHLVRDAAAPLLGKTVTILGLAFKEGTDDVRNSRALPLAVSLVKSGARLRLHDPQALEAFRREWNSVTESVGGDLTYCKTVEESLLGADVAVLQVAWPEYLRWSNTWSRKMTTPLLVDLRRAVPPAVARRAGLEIVYLGRGKTP